MGNKPYQEQFKSALEKNYFITKSALLEMEQEQRVVYYFASKLCKKQEIPIKYNGKTIAEFLNIPYQVFRNILSKLKHLFYRDGKNGQRRRGWIVNPDLYSTFNQKQNKIEKEIDEKAKSIEIIITKHKTKERMIELKQEQINNELINEQDWSEIMEKSNINKNINLKVREDWKEDFIDDCNQGIKNHPNTIFSISHYLKDLAFSNAEIPFDYDKCTQDFIYDKKFKEHYGKSINIEFIKKICIAYVNYLKNNPIVMEYDLWMKNFLKWCFNNYKIQSKEPINFCHSYQYREMEYNYYQK